MSGLTELEMEAVKVIERFAKTRVFNMAKSNPWRSQLLEALQILEEGKKARSNG